MSPRRRDRSSPAASLTWTQALAWRARRHRLDERVPHERKLEVAGALCGLHAQVMSSAELTLWARVDGLRRDDMSRALWKDRSLVKTWAMRGTLHLLPAADWPVWRGALGTAFDHYRRPAWARYFGVTPDELERITETVGESLAGRALTRQELASDVASRTKRKDLAEKLTASWGSLLKPAAVRGWLCFAESAGQNVRFTNPDTWLVESAPMDGEAALREVARRYLAAYGPARREDLARWWGWLSAARAQRVIESLGEDLTEVDVEGTAAWMLTRDVPDAAKARTRTVRLLPGFDQYVVGSARDVPALLAPEFRARVHRPQGWISPVLLVDGRMGGVWKHERKGKRLVVTIEPFDTVAARVRRAAEAEAERLADFLGGTLEVAWP